MKPELSIAIVNFNTKELVYDCLRSLRNNVKTKYEVILVENGSSSKKSLSQEEIEKILPKSTFKLIVSAENLGFGGGNNLGARKAQGKYLFLLNPDTVVIDDSVDKMVDFLSKHREVGALTCILYNDLNCEKIQKNFFGKFQSLAGLTVRRYNYQKIDRSKEFLYTDIITGAALMLKKALFDKVQGFDENIFMYLEDDDLCKRVVDLGYKNAVLNTARIVHLEGQSSSGKEKKQYYYKSQDYYWRKHNGFFVTVLMKIIRWPMKVIKTSR